MSDLTQQTKDDMELLIRNMGAMGREKDFAAGVVEALQSQHRTTQQTFFRVFALAMEEYKNTPTDLRNEASVNYAGEISKIDFHFPFI